VGGCGDGLGARCVRALAVELPRWDLAAGQGLGGDSQCRLARLLVRRVLEERTLPPLFLLIGHKPSSCEGPGVVEAAEVGAISAAGVRGEGADAGIWVRSTPKMRFSSGPISKWKLIFAGV